MVKEDYCSYEVAKLLKEKGFDWECEHVIWDGADDNYDNYDKAIPDPTHQMAMKWLREVHGLLIVIGNDYLGYWFTVEDIINKDENLYPVVKANFDAYKTYEQTVEAALRYTLDNLI